MTTPPSDPFAKLQWVIASLREHCPWTAQLTHEALTPYLVEESQEVIEEIDAGVLGDPLRRELGDLLLQIVLHAQIASEREDFDFGGVAEAITAKLIRRSPHVFTSEGELSPTQASLEEIDAAWQRIKAEEKTEEKAPEAAGEQAAEAVAGARDDDA